MKGKIILILVIVALLGGVFYWFQWRSAKIRERCAVYMNWSETDYVKCMRERGLEK